MLARDADGSVVLTVAQAVGVATMERHDWEPAPWGSDEDLLWRAFFEIESDDCTGPGNKVDALARWVLRVAPIVQAAIRQRAAGLAMLDDGDGDREWVDACSATETAVSRAFGEIEVAA